MHDIIKLPRWAQDRIAKLERERDTAIRALDEYCDAQTPSSIYYDEWLSTGEKQGSSGKRIYVQSDHVVIDAHGVNLSVRIESASRALSLQWGRNTYGGDVCMQPRSYQNVWLIAKEIMK